MYFYPFPSLYYYISSEYHIKLSDVYREDIPKKEREGGRRQIARSILFFSFYYAGEAFFLPSHITVPNHYYCYHYFFFCRGLPKSTSSVAAVFILCSLCKHCEGLVQSKENKRENSSKKIHTHQEKV